MNANQLSEICHLATRLQSAGMIHVANVRECRTSDDDLATVAREAESILKMTEQLAFRVGQLQLSVAAEVRRPKLDEFVMLGRAMPEVERLDMGGMLAAHRGGVL